MKILVGSFGIPYLAASLISITLCSLLNFFVSDRLVFR
jgi:putative flippase GtrA